MKFNRILSAALAAGIALATVACQKVDELSSKPVQASGKSLTVTATIADINGTKVSYAFTDNDAKKAIKQTWQVGDQIFGFDNEGGTFTFEVESVEKGVAKFKFTDDGNNIADDATKLYAVYYPGKTAFDANNELAVDLTENNGVLNGDDAKAPVIMCATGTIDNGAVSFSFANQTAVVGIYKMQIYNGDTPVDDNTEIKSVTLNNVITDGIIKIDEKTGNLNLVPGENMKSITASVSLNTQTIENVKGFIEASSSSMIPYFSVIPGNSEISVSVSDGTNTYRNQSAIPAKALEAGSYYYLGKTMSTTVAKIGETSYPSLASAIEAVSSSDATEITLASVTEEDCTIPESKNITLNLDGRTIQGCITVKGNLTVKDVNNTGKIFNDGPCLEVKANGNLTINGGTVETNSSDDNNGATIVINKDGDKEQIDGTIVTFNGGKISQTGTSKRGAIDAKYSTITFPNTSTTVITSKERAFVSGAGVKLTIDAGSFKSDDSYTIFLNNGTNGSALIKGGSFDGGSNCFQIYGTSTNVQINDGKHKWNNADNFLSLASSAKGSQLTIKGGKFMKSVSSYVPDGYACLDNEDDDSETYAKKVAECKILVGTNICQNYTDAMTCVNEAEKDITMTLYDNITLSADDSLYITNQNDIAITLDLNGKKLMSSSSAKGKAVLATKAKNFTIMDSGEGGEISQNTENDSWALSVRGGTCKITGGKITQSNGTGYSNRVAIQAFGHEATAVLEISGGEITSGASAILFGSGYSAKPVTVNISGGLIKARETRKENNAGTVQYVDNYQYALIRSYNTRGTLNITGGTFYVYYQPILYLGSNYTKVTINKATDSMPYFYQEHADENVECTGKSINTTIFKSRNVTSTPSFNTATFYEITDCYTNARNVDQPQIFSNPGATEHSVADDDPLKKDSYGNTYTKHFYKE